MNGLAASDFADEWDWFYRWQRFWRARSLPRPPRVTRRLLADSWGNRSADLFHGLNQRLPKRRFRRQIATFHDLFVLSGEYSTPEFRERFARQAREAAAGADLIIAVSAFTGSQVQYHLNVPAERIRVIHHGVVARRIPGSRAGKSGVMRGGDSAAQEPGDAGARLPRHAGRLDSGAGRFAGLRSRGNAERDIRQSVRRPDSRHWLSHRRTAGAMVRAGRHFRLPVAGRRLRHAGARSHGRGNSGDRRATAPLCRRFAGTRRS